MKQKQAHGPREGTDLWLPRGREVLRVWDWQMQTTIYRMDKHKGPAV